MLTVCPVWDMQHSNIVVIQPTYFILNMVIQSRLVDSAAWSLINQTVRQFVQSFLVVHVTIPGP